MRKPERGAASVELAAVMIFLMLLVSGVFEIGRAILISISLEDAAQEGAMFASYNPGDAAEIKARVVDSVDSPAISLSDVTVSCLNPNPCCMVGGNEIKVTVRHRVDVITPLMTLIVGDHFDLQRDSVSRAFEGECLIP